MDTAEKRRAALNVTSFSGPGVTPNSSEDVEWRQQVAHSYSGIAPASPGGGGGNALLLRLQMEGLFVGSGGML